MAVWVAHTAHTAFSARLAPAMKKLRQGLAPITLLLIGFAQFSNAHSTPQPEYSGSAARRPSQLVETLRDVDPAKIAVSEAMTMDTYVVTPDASLDEVVSTMAAKKYGSAVVTDHGHVVGIFTTVDACSAFADLLATRLTH